MNVLCIVPARGGSKGVHRKNIRIVAGKPLIGWSLDAGLAAASVDKCYVTTDDDEIAQVAASLGGEIIMRPAELAGDKTPMIDTLLHALLECEKSEGVTYDYILLLQPTAPMRNAEDIDAALNLLESSDADSVMSVYQVEDAHPSRMYHINNGQLETFYEEPKGSLRQDLPAVYHRNGAVYACKRELLVEEKMLWGGHIVPYVMPIERSANIDSELDLEWTEFLMTKKIDCECA